MKTKSYLGSAIQGLGLVAALVGAYMIAAGLAVCVLGGVAIGVGYLVERRSRAR